jgi:hypothetical protein
MTDYFRVIPALALKRQDRTRSLLSTPRRIRYLQINGRHVPRSMLLIV